MKLNCTKDNESLFIQVFILQQTRDREEIVITI